MHLSIFQQGLFLPPLFACYCRNEVSNVAAVAFVVEMLVPLLPLLAFCVSSGACERLGKTARERDREREREKRRETQRGERRTGRQTETDRERQRRTATNGRQTDRRTGCLLVGVFVLDPTLWCFRRVRSRDALAYIGIGYWAPDSTNCKFRILHSSSNEPHEHIAAVF